MTRATWLPLLTLLTLLSVSTKTVSAQEVRAEKSQSNSVPSLRSQLELPIPLSPKTDNVDEDDSDFAARLKSLDEAHESATRKRNQQWQETFERSQPGKRAKPPATNASYRQPATPQTGSTAFRLAEQPKPGEHFLTQPPQTDSAAYRVDYSPHDFTPDPIDPALAYDADSQIKVYEGKQLNANQRPLLEIGRPWYQLGPLKHSRTFLGRHNLVSPQFIAFGDFRAAVASNRTNGQTDTQFALEWNLNLDLKVTATERFHMFMSPLDRGNRNTRYLFDDGEFFNELDPNVEFGFLEGDLGAIWGGFVGTTLPFDAPFAIGVMPLLFQNGVWFEDDILGVAATIPARSSARWNISNMDITFFAGFDDIDSPAFEGDDDVAKLYGIASFIEALGGYFEIDYAYLEDRDTTRDRSYHNIGFAYSRRYGRFISNSVRCIVNAGQSTAGGANTADGTLLLIENSLITSAPSTFVPYFNLFAGFDRPQSASRNGAAGGVLRNTGILFESDGMTNYPTLDATGNDTYGAAFGLNILATDFSQQLILEAAVLQVHGNAANRNAPGNQYGTGFRYQIPITNAVLLRADGMVGFLDNTQNVHGLRFEVRHKF